METMTIYRAMGMKEFQKLSSGSPIKGNTHLSYIRKGYQTGGSGVFFAECEDRPCAIGMTMQKFSSLHGEHSVLVEFVVRKDVMTETWGEYYYSGRFTPHREREWCIPEYDRTVVVPVAYTMDLKWDDMDEAVWYPFN